MKRKTAFITALALCTSSITAFAETNDGTSPTEIQVSANYTDSKYVTVSADIKWDDMTFEYTESGKIWNTKTHQYEATAGGWSAESKEISVTNHSNADIKADLAFTSNIEGLKGEFSKSKIKLVTAEGTTPAEAPADSAKFSVSGTAIESDSALGNITVTITATTDAYGYTLVGSEAEMKEALEGGNAKVRLTNDLTNVQFDMTGGSVVDLNGFTITGWIYMGNDGEYTIRNGKIVRKDYNIYVWQGTVTLENCEIESNSNSDDGVEYGTVCNVLGITNIRNCTIRNKGGGKALYNTYGTVNISGNVNIEGQIVNNKNMNVYAGRYNFDPTEYVDANNLTVTQEDEYWVVNNNRR